MTTAINKALIGSGTKNLQAPAVRLGIYIFFFYLKKNIFVNFEKDESLIKIKTSFSNKTFEKHKIYFKNSTKQIFKLKIIQII
jgi:hypothetical protein